MKPKIVLPAFLLIVLSGVALWVYFGPTPDLPTRATSPDQLALQTWPTDLPPRFVPIASHADAAVPMVRCLNYYNAHADLAGNTPDPKHVRRLADLLLQAMRCGQVTPGFLDTFLDIDYSAQPRFGQALEGVAAAALNQADLLARQGQADKADQLNRAVWALGQRAYEDNVLMYPRYTGLQLMTMAGQQCFDFPGQDQAALTQWGLALQTLRNHWDAKLALVTGVAPHLGDLVNVALHDKERTFRIAAMLQLGIAKFSPGHRGNLRAIQSAIDAGRRDPDPLIVIAAGKADRLTRDQLHRIR